MACESLFSRLRSNRIPVLMYWAAVLTSCLGLLVTGVGCGGGSSAAQTEVGPAPATLVSIAVTPSTVSVVVGSSQQFTATGKYSDSTTKDLTSSASWSSSAPGVATVSSSGLATAVASGQTGINASMDTVSAPAASLTVETQGPPGSLGSVTATSISCPASTVGVSGTCYQAAISCPNIDDFTGYVKVTYPTVTPVGTVVFTSGGNGTTLYETFKYGPTAFNTLLQAGYTVAQISWGEPFTAGQTSGWETGPGGIRAVACRYATLAQWIYNNIHLANKGAPFCATGNSGGSAIIGLAMAHYGMGSIFTMVEPTSGPPFSRQDWACDWQHSPQTDPCGNPDRGFGIAEADAVMFIDPAYAPPVSCSYEVEHLSTIYDSTFLPDSVMSPDAVLNYPNTFVKFLYGGMDTSTAPNQGHLWESAITSSKAEACVADAGHSMPDSQDAAQQIASDILTYCKLPAGGNP
jgi:hypothetical protein